MDIFTERILERARERQKVIGDKSGSPSRKANRAEETQMGTSEIEKETSDLNDKHKVAACLKQSASEAEGNTLNIQRENIDVQIKVRSSENVRIEVELQEQDENEGPNAKPTIREDANNKLKRLAKLYSGVDISSPIHRTEANFNAEDTSTHVKDMHDISEHSKTRKGISKLAELAKNINNWEDDVKAKLTHTRDKLAVPKKSWKSPAPQPPVQNLNNRTSSAESNSSKVKWDQEVLDTLESQGFTRTESSSKLVYKFNSDNKAENSHLKHVKEEDAEMQEKANLPTRYNKSEEQVASPLKRSNLIANKASMFENSPTKAAKDPALLSVGERKALFERNQGAALLPKAAFGMATPAQPYKAKNINKPEICKPIVTSITSKTDSPSKAAILQSGGIASKMAAFLQNKSTISQEQIQSNTRHDRQKEMDVLLNRFNRNKETPIMEESSDDESDNEKAVMIKAKPNKIVANIEKAPSSPKKRVDKRRSSDKPRISSSPQVAAVLEDVKRIKVTQPKQGNLYPCLSDIEANTETEAEQEPNTSSENSLCESDDANTSFGREVLKAACTNVSVQESDASDILDDMDEYLNERLPDDIEIDSAGPTPPKQGKVFSGAPQPSLSFSYKCFSPKQKTPLHQENSEFKSPLKTGSPRKSELQTFVVEGESLLPLTHTVSFYRKQQNQQKTPLRQFVKHQQILEEEKENSFETDAVQHKLRELATEVSKQEMIISQTSQALNLCSATFEFSGSTEQVEAEKVLLLATHRRRAALHEIQRLRVEGTVRPQGPHAENVPLEKGSLSISNINLPLKREYVRALAAAGGKGHHVVCLVKCGDQVVATQLVSTVASSSKHPDLELNIPGYVRFASIYSDFAITFEVYCLQAQEEILTHEVKYHINKKASKLTPRKTKQDSRLIRPPKESPAGPTAVRSPTFALMGYVVFSIQAVNRTQWSLNKAPSMSPLEGVVEMKVQCELAVSAEHRGFLTVFEDVSGFGAWHRRWYLLKGDTLSYWKYPDEEKKRAPIDSIDLKNCITKQVGLVSREICARLHTILIERQRSAHPNDKDSLTTICEGEKTVVRHLFSADTKEERLEWTNMFNKALHALRTWGNSLE